MTFELRHTPIPTLTKVEKSHGAELVYHGSDGCTDYILRISIPADPDRDDDLVLSAAIEELDASRAEVERLREALAEAFAWLGAAKRSGTLTPVVYADIEKAFWAANNALRACAAKG